MDKSPESPSPISNDPQPNQEYHHHTFTKWLAIGLAALITLSISTYLFLQLFQYNSFSNKSKLTPTPSTQPSPTPDPTTNWQVYSNEEYGFEIKYPTNYTLEKYDGFENGESKIFEIQDCYYPQLNCTSTKKLLSISVDKLSDKATAEKKVQEYFIQPPQLADCHLNNEFIERSETNIDNFTAYEKKYKTGDILSTCDNPPQGIGVLLDEKIITYFNNENEVYTISQSVADEDIQKVLDAVEELDQILSTFRFTETQITPPPGQRPSGPEATPTGQITQCTLEAKICPDGVTTVGRSGPNCEFSPCPPFQNQ